MTAVALRDVSRPQSLKDLAEAINQEHAQVLEAGTAMIEHAIRAGEALLEAKKRFKQGEWRPWLLETFPDRSIYTSYRYTRIAQHADVVRAGNPHSLLAAVQLTTGRPRAKNAGHARREEACRLHQSGQMTIREIAEEFGVSYGAVWWWLNPKKQKEAASKQRHETVKARRALKAQERKSLVQVKGGPTADAYSLVRKALGRLDEAVGSDDVSREARRHLSAAIAAMHRAEDEIVKASKLS